MRAILDRIGSLSGLWEEDACERGGGVLNPSHPVHRVFRDFYFFRSYSVGRSVARSGVIGVAHMCLNCLD